MFRRRAQRGNISNTQSVAFPEFLSSNLGARDFIFWKSPFSSRSPTEISFNLSERMWCYTLKIDLFIKNAPRHFVQHIRAHVIVFFENDNFHQDHTLNFRSKILVHTYVYRLKIDLLIKIAQHTFCFKISKVHVILSCQNRYFLHVDKFEDRPREKFV